MDAETRIQEIKDLVREFRDARDWQKYNDPKSVAEALSIEAGELLECFLWKEKPDIAERFKNDPVFREHVAEELADVLIYAIHMANETGIDMAAAVRDKIAKNEAKYPVAAWKGIPTKNIGAN
ncbi:MAG: nucleotide pyrophosphohydrolase [Candidatus Kaiserbacteria bacterium]|nr:nucleotide pyrophosphohydrolase [Candidatus Kaiserbacteria bacterium]